METEKAGILDERKVKEVIDKFSEIQDKEPEEFVAGVRENELKLVELRDSIMNVPRQQRSPDQKHQLEKISMALSLVIGLEYPVSNLERSKLKDATELLKTL